ncbi:hypothetical protein Tco_1247790 [Tanacetum coccineum]
MKRAGNQRVYSFVRIASSFLKEGFVLSESNDDFLLIKEYTISFTAKGGSAIGLRRETLTTLASLLALVCLCRDVLSHPRRENTPLSLSPNLVETFFSLSPSLVKTVVLGLLRWGRIWFFVFQPGEDIWALGGLGVLLDAPFQPSVVGAGCSAYHKIHRVFSSGMGPLVVCLLPFPAVFLTIESAGVASSFLKEGFVLSESNDDFLLRKEYIVRLAAEGWFRDWTPA